MTGTVYAIRCKRTGGMYIGATVREPALRFAHHWGKRNSGTENARLHAAMRRDGRDGFEVVLLELAIPPEQLADAEIRWINRLRAAQWPLYNGWQSRYSGDRHVATLAAKEAAKLTRPTAPGPAAPGTNETVRPA